MLEVISLLHTHTRVRVQMFMSTAGAPESLGKRRGDSCCKWRRFSQPAEWDQLPSWSGSEGSSNKEVAGLGDMTGDGAWSWECWMCPGITLLLLSNRTELVSSWDASLKQICCQKCRSAHHIYICIGRNPGALWRGWFAVVYRGSAGLNLSARARRCRFPPGNGHVWYIRCQ